MSYPDEAHAAGPQRLSLNSRQTDSPIYDTFFTTPCRSIGRIAVDTATDIGNGSVAAKSIQAQRRGIGSIAMRL